METLALKLPPGADLRKSIELVGAEKAKSGFVLGVVGNLSKAVFQCPGKQLPTVLEGNLEIITLNGTFSNDGKVHLHLSLSDGECQVWGGHLELGTKVLKGADLLLACIGSENTQLKYATIEKKNTHRLELAVLPECPWSEKAIKIIRRENIPCLITTVDSDSLSRNYIDRSKTSTFPQIFLDGEFLGGFNELFKLHQSGKLKRLN